MSEAVVSWAFVAWGVLWMRDGLEDKIVVYRLIVCVSAAVLRFLGVRCYRIGFSLWVLSKLF